MFLHFSDSDIAKLGLYDSIELLDRAIEEKEKFEILIIASGGVINPEELEQYSKYYTLPEVDASRAVEEDMKEFKKLSEAMARKNER